MNNHYVDNNRMLELFIGYRKQVDKALSQGKKQPPIPNEIGAMINKMIDKMSTRHNFKRYTWLDDMKGDALVDCIKVANNFVPNLELKKVNVFGYFSIIIFRAFVNRIQIENRQQKIKRSYMFNSCTETCDYIEHDVDEAAKVNLNEEAFKFYYQSR